MFLKSRHKILTHIKQSNDENKISKSVTGDRKDQ